MCRLHFSIEFLVFLPTCCKYGNPIPSPPANTALPSLLLQVQQSHSPTFCKSSNPRPLPHNLQVNVQQSNSFPYLQSTPSHTYCEYSNPATFYTCYKCSNPTSPPSCWKYSNPFSSTYSKFRNPDPSYTCCKYSNPTPRLPPAPNTIKILSIHVFLPTLAAVLYEHFFQIVLLLLTLYSIGYF